MSKIFSGFWRWIQVHTKRAHSSRRCLEQNDFQQLRFWHRSIVLRNQQCLNRSYWLVDKSRNQNKGWMKQFILRHNEPNQMWQSKTICRSGKNCLKNKKWINQTLWNHFQRCCSLRSTQTRIFGFGKSKWDIFWNKLNRSISQNDSMVAWHYPTRSTFWL